MIKTFSRFLAENVLSDAPDVSHREKVEGPRGSNPGGVYHDSSTNSKHYMKFYSNPQQARSEVAAGKIYSHVGVHNLQPSLAQHNGKLAVSTQWNDKLENVNTDYHKWDHHGQVSLAKHFVAGVITKNWDAVGLDHDNIMKSPEGHLHSVDLGGTFKFRAQGGPKPFDHDIAEHDSFKNPEHTTGEAFGHLKHEHIKAALDTMHVSKEEATEHFRSAGVKDPEHHGSVVAGRLQQLKDKYK